MESMLRGKQGFCMFARHIRGGPPIECSLSVAFRLVMRQCSRPTCAESAAATLTYQYAKGIVWVDLMTAERDPHGYDLCERHASRISVPHGWRMDDRRQHAYVPQLRWVAS
jgi:Protein of unknown function (DUF3499)